MKVLCIDDRFALEERPGGYVVKLGGEETTDLTPGGVYDVLAIEDGWYRVVDDSGEDYLYPPQLFEALN